MSKITIEQKGKNEIDLTINVAFREIGVSLTQPNIEGCIDEVFVKFENLPALITALDPERDKRIQELESQLEEAKNQLQNWSQ
jgi:hypothetical protein